MIRKHLPELSNYLRSYCCFIQPLELVHKRLSSEPQICDLLSLPLPSCLQPDFPATTPPPRPLFSSFTGASCSPVPGTGLGPGGMDLIPTDLFFPVDLVASFLLGSIPRGGTHEAERGTNYELIRSSGKADGLSPTRRQCPGMGSQETLKGSRRASGWRLLRAGPQREDTGLSKWNVL